MNVLIVDDNRDDRTLLTLLFEAHGCSVRQAQNGREGLQVARSWLPDLIISDALMPEMDGFQFLRAAKADATLGAIPFVFYSAVYTGRHEEKLALSLGAEAFIVKPVEPEALWKEIERLRLQRIKGAAPAVMADQQKFLGEYSDIVVAKLQEKVAELEQAQGELTAKQQQLEELNRSLERRIDEKVAELRRMDQVLIQQYRISAMGEVLNNIAHQWRQPLNNIGLMVQNLRLDIPPDALDPGVLEGHVQKIMQALQDLSRTIDRFRTFFRQDHEPRIFAVSEALTQLRGIIEPALESSGIAFGVTVEGEKPVFGCMKDLAQALLNIITNARDVLVEGRVAAPEIRVRVWPEGDATLVTVTDNGGGMREEVLEKIFDPYFTTGFMAQGKGICLYMSKVIVEKNMGGTLSARNVEGGAEFRALLPAGEPAPTAQRGADSRSQRGREG